MAKDNKHNPNDASIRGGAKVSDMKKKNKDYYKAAKGRPYRYQAMLKAQEEAEKAELEAIQRELEEKAKADAEEKAEAEKPKKKKKSSKKKE
tara:strand:+ start:147 stop:422 length:276 start_codon:yes stop_codon:yes gene_type:complete